MNSTLTLRTALPFLLLAFVVSSTGWSREWVFPEDALTSEDQAAEELQYFEHFVELYREHTKDKGELKERGEQLLQFDAVSISHGVRSPAAQALSDIGQVEYRENKIKQIRQLVLAGSNDPLILKMLASYSTDKSYQWRLDRMKQAITEFEKSDYPVAVLFRLLSDQATYANSMGRANDEVAAVKRLYKILPDYVGYVSSRPFMIRKALSTIRILLSFRRLPQTEGDQMIAALSNRKDANAWLARMIRGYYYDQLGWRYRGGAFAFKVSDDKMKKFGEYQKKAAQQFLAAQDIAPGLPEAAAGLIDVTRAIGPVDGRDTDDWFQAALNAQTDFRHAISAYKFSIRPRWSGSHRQMLEFGVEMSKSERYDTELPDALMSSLYDLHSELKDWNAVLQIADVYRPVMDHLDRRIAQIEPAGDIRLRRFYLTQAMTFAFYHADFAEAMKRKEALDGDYDSSVLATFDLTSKASLSSIDAFHQFGWQPFATEVEEGSRYAKFKSPQDHIDRLNRQVVPDLSPEAEPFVTRQIRLAKLAIDYEAGKWVPLHFNSEFSDWFGVGNNWEFVNPKTAIVEANSTIDMSHVLMTEGPREIEWTMDVISGTPKSSSIGVQLGLVRGLWSDHGDNAVAVLVDPTEKTFRTYYHSDYREQKKVFQTPKRVRVKAWAPELEVYMDGRLVQSIAPKGWTDVKEINGIYQKRSSTATYRFKDIRIRRLDHDPTPNKMSPEGAVAYYGGLLEKDPDFVEYLRRYGEALHNSGKAADAITPLKKAADLDPRHTQLHESYARALIASKRYAEALNRLQHISELTRKNKQWHGLSLAHHAKLLASVPDDELRNGSLANKIARRAFQYRKDDQVVLWIALAISQAEQGEFKNAKESITKARQQAVKGYLKKEISKVEAAIEQQKPYRVGE